MDNSALRYTPVCLQSRKDLLEIRLRGLVKWNGVQMTFMKISLKRTRGYEIFKMVTVFNAERQVEFFPRFICENCYRELSLKIQFLFGIRIY